MNAPPKSSNIDSVKTTAAFCLNLGATVGNKFR